MFDLLKGKMKISSAIWRVIFICVPSYERALHLVYTYFSDGKKSRNLINLSEKEKNLHFSDKTLYTLQRALYKECLRLSNFTLQLLSLLIGFMSRSPSISNWSEDSSLFKFPLHCLWSDESTLIKVCSSGPNCLWYGEYHFACK